jgi:sugar phosphate permease
MTASAFIVLFNKRICRLRLYESSTKMCERKVHRAIALVYFLCKNWYGSSMDFAKLRAILGLGLLCAALAALLFLTDPQKVPIVLLVAPFLLVGAMLLVGSLLFIRKFFPAAARRKRLLYAVTIAGFPTFTLVLSSINQLTWRDAILVVVLVGCLIFYVNRVNFSSQ